MYPQKPLQLEDYDTCLTKIANCLFSTYTGQNKFTVKVNLHPIFLSNSLQTDAGMYSRKLLHGKAKRYSRRLFIKHNEINDAV